MKLFKSKEYKRAVKIHNEAQEKIAAFTSSQLKFKANQQEYWIWQDFIDREKTISETCAKIIGDE